MNSITQPPPLPKARRPALVWVIVIFYFLSAGYTTLSIFLVYSGAIPLDIDPAQKHYFSSLTVFDYLTTVAVAGCNLTGTILLLLLRRQAFYLYGAAFGINLLLTVHHTLTKGWVQALHAFGGAGLIGAMIVYGISIAVITYAHRLNQRGITR